eukprot:6449682-Amphidinium_carterae.1
MRWTRLLPSLGRSHPGSRFSAGKGAAGAGDGQYGLRSAGLLHCLVCVADASTPPARPRMWEGDDPAT